MRRGLAVALALFSASTIRAAEGQVEPPLMVYAAGSTTGVLSAMLKRYEQETGRKVDLRTGPAGLMRERIEAGDKVDLFVSANMAHPEKLHAEDKGSAVTVFARNRLCVTAQHEVGLTSANLLDKLLDPKVRIGTSTPGADPGGDYAQLFFERADTVRPGATAALKAKARQVVGSQIETAPAKPMTGREGMSERGVDVSIGYCSSRTTSADPSVDKVEIPEKLAIHADYGLTILTTSLDDRREAAAGQLAIYLLTPNVQALLPAYGFEPSVGQSGK